MHIQGEQKTLPPLFINPSSSIDKNLLKFHNLFPFEKNDITVIGMVIETTKMTGVVQLLHITLIKISESLC